MWWASQEATLLDENSITAQPPDTTVCLGDSILCTPSFSPFMYLFSFVCVIIMPPAPQLTINLLRVRFIAALPPGDRASVFRRAKSILRQDLRGPLLHRAAHMV